MNLCRTCLSAEDLSDIFPDSAVNRRKEQLIAVTGVKNQRSMEIAPSKQMAKEIEQRIKIPTWNRYRLLKEISPNDGLPQKICKQCSKLIDLAVKLRETSAYAEKMLIQNGFHYSKRKLVTKKEKTDLKIKQEYDYSDNNDCDFQDYDDKTKVAYGNCLFSDLSKSTTTKKNCKAKKAITKKRKTKCFTKIIPETSTYNIDRNTIDLLTPVSNNNTDSLSILHNIASMLPNDPSIDDNIQKIINNIDAQEKLQPLNKTSPKDDLLQIYNIIDSKIELIDDVTKTKPKIKTDSLEDELIKHLKKEDDKKPLQKRLKSSTIHIDKIYNIIDTKIDILDIKDKTSKSPKDLLLKKRQNPRWSAERLKTFWSLAVEPFQRNERVQCKICHKFTKYLCFTKHASTHFEPEFTCEVCGLKLMSKKNLADHHQRKHGATKNFACTQCDYRSVLSAELQNHVRRVHTGEKPFICDLCSESFYQRRCLVAHMKVHFAEKKYQCDRCSNMFKSQGQLTAHYNRYHIMRYTFYCDHCPYQVSKSTKVKDHLTKVHGIPRDKQAPIKFFKERREESLYGETTTKHLRKPEDVVKKLSFK